MYSCVASLSPHLQLQVAQQGLHLGEGGEQVAELALQLRVPALQHGARADKAQVLLMRPCSRTDPPAQQGQTPSRCNRPSAAFQ